MHFLGVQMYTECDFLSRLCYWNIAMRITAGVNINLMYAEAGFAFILQCECGVDLSSDRNLAEVECAACKSRHRTFVDLTFAQVIEVFFGKCPYSESSCLAVFCYYTAVQDRSSPIIVLSPFILVGIYRERYFSS